MAKHKPYLRYKDPLTYMRAVLETVHASGDLLAADLYSYCSEMTPELLCGVVSDEAAFVACVQLCVRLELVTTRRSDGIEGTQLTMRGLVAGDYLEV
jgi:hypothetical protein